MFINLPAPSPTTTLPRKKIDEKKKGSVWFDLLKALLVYCTEEIDLFHYGKGNDLRGSKSQYLKSLEKDTEY